MKKTVFILLSSLLLSTPVWAQQTNTPHKHQGHQQDKAESYTPALIKERLPMAQKRILELKNLAKRSVELMQMAHKLTAQAQQNKNLETAVQAKQTFMAGHDLHHETMQMLQKMQAHLAEHVNEHQSGKVVLDNALLNQVISAHNDLGQFIQTHRAFCQQNIKPLNQKARQDLIALGNQHFEKSLAASNTQALLQAVELLKFPPMNH